MAARARARACIGVGRHRPRAWPFPRRADSRAAAEGGGGGVERRLRQRRLRRSGLSAGSECIYSGLHSGSITVERTLGPSLDRAGSRGTQREEKGGKGR